MKLLKLLERPEFFQSSRGAKLRDKEGKQLKHFSVEEVSDNMSFSLLEKGNFFKPPNTFFLWFHKTEDWADKVNAGEYDWVFFPPAGSYSYAVRSGGVLDRVWKMAKKARGGDEVVGMIEGEIYEGEAVILYMAVRPGYKKNTINSKMLEQIERHLGKKIAFHDPTDDGLGFIKSRYPNATIYDRNWDIVNNNF